MNRRNLFKSVAATGFAIGFGRATARATIPEHNWDKYDWGPGPAVPTGSIKDLSRSMVRAP